MIDEQWLASWVTRLEAATARALREVLASYPFEPDEHRIGPPAVVGELAALRERVPWVPDDLLTLYRQVGPVSLPDIANGYYIHAPKHVAADSERAAVRPDRVGAGLADPVDVVVFGSNGGGDLYALVTTSRGPVYRLRDAGYEAGVYHGTRHGVAIVGDDLHHFLGRLLTAVETFADRGDVTDL